MQLRAPVFAVLEGIDGAGTTTQAKLLAAWLDHVVTGAASPVCLTEEPSTGEIGRLIRRVLTGDTQVSADSLALLFAADRLEHMLRRVGPQLNSGASVVSDRSVYSSLAYQSVTQSLSWVAEINGRAREPDLTIYLRVEVQVAEQRRKGRGEAEELFDKRDTQGAVAAQYDRLLGSSEQDGTWVWRDDARGWARNERRSAATALRERIGRGSAEVAVIDGSLAVEQVHNRICRLLELAFGV